MKKYFYLCMIMTLGLVINLNAQKLYLGIKNNMVATKALQNGESGTELHFFKDIVAEDFLLLDPPTALIAEVDLDNVNLSWTSPSSGGLNNNYLRYDNEVNAACMQIGNTSVAIRWDPGGLVDYNGYIINKIKFYVGTAGTATFTLRVWEGQGAVNSLVTQPVSGVVDGWNEFVLDSPVTIDGSLEYWIGYDIEGGNGEFVPGYDAGPAVDGYSNMAYYYGAWQGVADIGNFNIAAYAENTNGRGEYLGKGLLSFNLYRENQIIGNTTETTFMDGGLSNGVFDYYVTAVYDEGESEASNTVNVVVGDIVIEKNVVIEEGTGTWCSWCPRGFYYGDSLTHANNNVFLIAVHGGDEMENTPHVEGAAITSYPSGNFDRSIIEASPLSWFSVAETALAEMPVAGIEVSNTFNQATNELTVDVSALFAESVSGDYRLGAVILENGVTGAAPQYSQSNSFSGGSYGNMGGFEELPSPVPANMIAYNHVSRQLLGGYAGEPNSLPTNINVGETHNFSFNYTIPSEWDADQVYVIAWLIKPDGKIDNSAKSNYITGSVNAKPLFISNPMTTAYVGNNYTYVAYTHDPDNSELEIIGAELPSWLTLSPTTTLGHIHNSATLSGTPTHAGSYNVTLTISDGEYEIAQSYIIVVEGATGGTWELIGDAGFTDVAVYNQDMVVADNGTIYLITQNQDAEILEVFKKEAGSSWQSMGLNQAAGTYGQIAVASDGTPYIAYTYNWSAIIVKKYNGSTWEQVGASPTTGVQIGLALDSNDNPHIACQDGGNEYEGWVYKYDGASPVLCNGSPTFYIFISSSWVCFAVGLRIFVFTRCDFGKT